MRKPLLFLLAFGMINILLYVIKHQAVHPEEAIPGIADPAPNKDSCRSCHTAMTGFAASHDPERIGCAACHLGDPGAGEKTLAHKDMILIPGNLADAAMTCGSLDCHPGIDVRVTNSLMNTMSGVVGVDKYVFGEIDSLDGFHDIRNLGDSAADTHLRNLCASCHLGREKRETGPVNESSRGGGCNACHLNYGEAAEAAHAKYHHLGDKALPKVHPSLSVNVTDDHCFGCHSRSGRISTNYEGWHETQFRQEDVVGKANIRVLEDGRVFTSIKDDVHHARGLACIDCHGSFDVMGYGRFAHEEEAVQADCRDCHTNQRPLTASYDQLDPESRRIVTLRNIDQEKRFVVGKGSKRPIINVFLNEEDQLVFLGKNSGKEYLLTPPGSKCTKGGAHSDLTCTSCHSSWAPQCISCHTTYDPNEEGYDLLDREMVEGAWMEKGGHYFADFPALGVVEGKASRKIKNFIPGMVMTLDRSGFSGKPDDQLHHRLYAPTSPHTIAAKGQSCKDCHNNPVALGYGRGELKYIMNGNLGAWSFKPQFAPWEHDGLPLDSWIGFLQDNAKGGIQKKNTTRTNARSFTLAEQHKILRVGACLTCHNEESETVKAMLEDFEKVLAGKSDQCLVESLKVR